MPQGKHIDMLIPCRAYVWNLRHPVPPFGKMIFVLLSSAFLVKNSSFEHLNATLQGGNREPGQSISIASLFIVFALF